MVLRGQHENFVPSFFCYDFFEFVERVYPGHDAVQLHRAVVGRGISQAVVAVAHGHAFDLRCAPVMKPLQLENKMPFLVPIALVLTSLLQLLYGTCHLCQVMCFLCFVALLRVDSHGHDVLQLNNFAGLVKYLPAF